MVGKNIFNNSKWLLVILFLFSFGDLYNPKERNILAFNDNINSVIDSITALNKIILKTDRIYRVYGIDIDMNNINRKENELFLYIHENSGSVLKVGKITDYTLHKNKFLNFIDSVERRHFINLIIYLNKNYLSGCDFMNSQPIYWYRQNIYMADRQKDLDRSVVLTSSHKNIDLNKYKILDRYKNLYLLANKDARIYSSD